MNAGELLTHLQVNGVVLSESNGRLDVEGDESLFTPEIDDEIRRHKEELLALLRPTPPVESEATCPECNGVNLVTDATGKYCIDCKRRPWEREIPSVMPTPSTAIKVSWGAPTFENGKKISWLRLENPLTGEETEIPAKGAPKWLFDRLNEQKEL